MPELPDVEVFKRYIDATALHQTVDRVSDICAELLEGVSASTLRRHVRKNSLASTRRHGKHLFVELTKGNRWLVLHFGMTGFVSYYKDPAGQPSHTRLLLGLANGYHLAYDDQRKLGFIGLVDDVDAFIAEKELGPDPLASDLSLEDFKAALAGARGTVKSTLMDQSRLAGIGNVYSDEILFQARVHPQTPVNKLDARRVRALYHKMIDRVLPGAIDAQAQPDKMPASFLTPYREKDGECPRCGRTLRTIKVSGRTAYVCAACQDR